ncbi:BAG family molecular chaperone regulator 2-like [Aristolochia californica]|uniref:BAG family molecular chaperone regulator 2-like n=1 Tax=Aristolochia californica TaxID=171875 RepID=UPI0035D8C5A7
MMKRSSLRGGVGESLTTMEGDIEWELRPGGMLVQKRAEQSASSAPIYRVRIAFGAVRYEISINSQSTFGELKKLISSETRLQPEEQRLIFRGKERGNNEYLDMTGVKDRSKIVLVEDPTNLEKRYIEMQRNAKLQSAHRAISDVSVELDTFAEQVSAIDISISSGKKVAELQITTLIEMFMRVAIKLDNISVGGDAAAQKDLQGKRIQKCVETLDMLKMANARIRLPVVTTKWETFDPPFSTQWELFD